MLFKVNCFFSFVQFYIYKKMLQGLIGKKIEMTQVFKDDGVIVPVTVIEVGPCIVCQIKSKEKDHYEAVQIGFAESNLKKIKKPLLGHFKNINRKPRFLKEFAPVKPLSEITIGEEIKITDVFTIGDKIEITGISKGHGFAGVVKKWGFHGGPKTHGQSDRHRAPGSIGGRTTPGRVYKGKKMSGHMGTDTITTKGLEIIEIDSEKNLMKIKGTVPGYRGSIITLVNKKNNLKE